MFYAKEKGAYDRNSDEAKNNAQETYALLGSLGWSLNAVCGLIGNEGAESGYNPWRWQSDNVQLSTGSPWTNHGYGFVQFTPASKYIDNARGYEGYAPNFSDIRGNVSDGIAQLQFINEKADYYPTSAYPLPYEEFKISSLDAGTLAKAWLYNYERPADPTKTEEERAENGLYWYEFLSGVIPPKPTTGKKMPLLFYMKRRLF